MMNGEVRLYFAGRLDWDTEYIQATCATDLGTQARLLAEGAKNAKGIKTRPVADHYTFGLATEQEFGPTHGMKHAPRGLAAKPADQVKAVQEVLGMENERARD